MKEGSAILREGDSFLVTLDTDVTIPEQPLNLTFTYTASFDTSDSGSIKDAFEAALITTAGDPLVYSFAPQRDAFFNVTEGLPSVLGRGTVERTVDTGNQVSLDISQLVPGTQAVVAFRLVNNDADEDTTIHILDVEVTSGTDAPPAVTVELANDTAPDGPGTDAYRSDLLTNDPRVSGTATDDDAITKLEVQVDNGPFTDITAALVNGQYSYDPGNLAAGSHRATVRATDTLSQTAESIIDFIVNALPMANAGGNRTVNEGDTVTFDGSGSSDSDDALFGYLWGFHDGNSATEVTSSHVYPQDGTFPVSLTVTDTAGSVSSDQIQVFVANVAATIAAVDDKQANEGDIVSLQTTFVDPGVLDTHTATIDWGDGTSPEPAQIVEQSGAGTVSSMHQYRDDGQYTVTIQVTDSDEAESSVQFDVHVDNLAPTVVTATDLNGTVGDRLDFTATFSDPGVLDTHTAIVQWGDGATSVAAVTENNGQGTVSANHAYALGGTHTIRVEVTDDAGEASDRLATATVIGGQLSSIAGYVYLDVNNNGIKDPPEKALPNVPVTLSGAVSWTVLTAADGSYRFDDLPQGTYAVTETQPLAFLDGRDTQGSLRLGTVASDQFQGLVLAADTHATDYNFGELGLRAELIGKYLYLASTPSAEELIARMMVPGERWATFQANDSGLLSVSIPLDVHSPVIEVYTGGMLPVTLSDGEHAASARVEEGATYVMYVAGQAESLPFETALQIDVSEPPGTPPTHPRYYINPVNALDTTGDGVVSPRDVLVVIDALNHGGEVNLDAGLLFLDVTGDEILSPRDVLVVINYLNSRDSVSGEGEEQAWSVLASAASTSESPTAFTKFYVVDSFADMTFGYGSDGSATTSFGLSRDVNQPSGITSNEVGDTLWVIDQRTHQVTVQASNAKLVGSWTAEGLVDPQGITTDGTDIWIVDAAQDRVVRYARAAVLTLGTADASDTFALDVENSSPSDITTDGSTVWVTDDQTDEVFVYDVAGALLGHWRLDPANADPSGITLDPSGGNDLWVVDRNDSEVYHYANSISLRDGSRVASDAFPLSGGNQHPEGIADPPIVTLSDPIGETALPAGQTLVLTGQTLDTNGPAAVVRIDGRAADAVDAAGNFFHQVQVAPGTNTYAIEASDTAGDTTTSTVTVRGTQLPAGAIDFAQLSVVSGSTFGLYGRTSWQDADSALYADFSIQNIGQYTVDGPVLVGVTNISDPTVRLRRPTGTTPDGIPYFDMSSLLNGDSLPPGDSSGLQTVSFFVPGRVHFTYDLVFFAAVNQPPRITTVPDVEAIAGRMYVYDVAATDPNGDALTFALLSSPDGMQIAAETGEITWSPGAADVGTHAIVVQAERRPRRVGRATFCAVGDRAAAESAAAIYIQPRR